MSNRNHTGTGSLHVVNEGDEWADETAPEAPNAVSNAALLRAIKRMEASFTAGFDKVGRWMRWAAFLAATGFGALAILLVLTWWSRP